MKVLATSDLHGQLPAVDACDLLLIGGDICPLSDHSPAGQLHWLDKVFRPWLLSIEAERIVGIAGNHDLVFENDPDAVTDLDLPWTYLQDSETDIEGLRIYGTPWVPSLPFWAFHGGMYGSCGTHFDDIPTGLDILLSHGPTHRYGDRLPDYGYVGSTTMAKRLATLKPRLFVCGHIHEGHGHYRHPHVQSGIYNVAYVDERYEPVHPVVDLSGALTERP